MPQACKGRAFHKRQTLAIAFELSAVFQKPYHQNVGFGVMWKLQYSFPRSNGENNHTVRHCLQFIQTKSVFKKYSQCPSDIKVIVDLLEDSVNNAAGARGGQKAGSCAIRGPGKGRWSMLYVSEDSAFPCDRRRQSISVFFCLEKMQMNPFLKYLK